MAPKKLKKDLSMKMPKARNNMTATMRVKSNEEKKVMFLYKLGV